VIAVVRALVIAIALAGALLDALVLSGALRPARLGVATAATLDWQYLQPLAEVVPGSAAEQAGLRTGERVRYAARLMPKPHAPAGAVAMCISSAAMDGSRPAPSNRCRSR
jgi:hypothetical protein